jgi:alpha-L-fucosidase
MWFGHKIGAGKWLPWSKAPVPGIADKGFSARWTGFLEPRFTEAFTFSAYVGPKDRVRMWIDDQLVIDDWAPADPKRRRPRQTDAGIDEVVSQPVPLTAGRRVAIRLEYASEGPEQGSLSLNWDSFTQERQRIPTAFLYPAAAGGF